MQLKISPRCSRLPDPTLRFSGPHPPTNAHSAIYPIPSPTSGPLPSASASKDTSASSSSHSKEGKASDESFSLESQPHPREIQTVGSYLVGTRSSHSHQNQTRLASYSGRCEQGRRPQKTPQFKPDCRVRHQCQVFRTASSWPLSTNISHSHFSG